MANDWHTNYAISAQKLKEWLLFNFIPFLKPEGWWRGTREGGRGGGRREIETEIDLLIKNSKTWEPLLQLVKARGPCCHPEGGGLRLWSFSDKELSLFLWLVAFGFSALVGPGSCQSSNDDGADLVICQKIPNQLQSLPPLGQSWTASFGDLPKSPLEGRGGGGTSKSREEDVGESWWPQPEMAMSTPQCFIYSRAQNVTCSSLDVTGTNPPPPGTW